MYRVSAALKAYGKSIGGQHASARNSTDTTREYFVLSVMHRLYISGQEDDNSRRSFAYDFCLTEVQASTVTKEHTDHPPQIIIGSSEILDKEDETVTRTAIPNEAGSTATFSPCTEEGNKENLVWNFFASTSVLPLLEINLMEKFSLLSYCSVMVANNKLIRSTHIASSTSTPKTSCGSHTLSQVSSGLVLFVTHSLDQNLTIDGLLFSFNFPVPLQHCWVRPNRNRMKPGAASTPRNLTDTPTSECVPPEVLPPPPAFAQFDYNKH
ncbi:hypothetical protein F4604DRAFT_1675179 [Suillus subluteus]|nr:hypothetical protein F4604DRAFT_1675179 [Suillus subluteus]